MAEPFDEIRILGYVEDELTPTERSAFEAELAENQQLQALVQAMVRDREAIQNLPRLIPPELLTDASMQNEERSMLLGPAAEDAIDTPSSKQQRRFRIGRITTYSGIAAGLLLCASVIIVTLSDPSLLQRSSEVAMNETPRSGPVVAMGESPSREVTRLAGLDAADGSEAGRGSAVSGSTSEAPVAATPREESLPLARDMYLYADLDERFDTPSSPETIAPARVEVRTDSVAATREDLQRWARLNSVIVEAKSPARGSSNRAIGEKLAIDDSAGIELKKNSKVADEQFVVVLDQEQVPELVRQLSQRSGQRTAYYKDGRLETELADKLAVKTDLADARQVAESLASADDADASQPPASTAMTPTRTTRSAEPERRREVAAMSGLTLEEVDGAASTGNSEPESVAMAEAEEADEAALDAVVGSVLSYDRSDVAEKPDSDNLKRETLDQPTLLLAWSDVLRPQVPLIRGVPIESVLTRSEPEPAKVRLPILIIEEDDAPTAGP